MPSPRSLIVLSLVLVTPASAVTPDEMLPDPALESRARAISVDLRRPVCQNQSIDDSNAPLARDLRLLVRERLKAGDSDAAVKRFVVARYGEFVLLSPPFAWHTLMLWLGPPLALLLTLSFLLVRGRRARLDLAARARDRLSADEEARLKSLIAAGDRSS